MPDIPKNFFAICYFNVNNITVITGHSFNTENNNFYIFKSFRQYITAYATDDNNILSYVSVKITY